MNAHELRISKNLLCLVTFLWFYARLNVSLMQRVLFCLVKITEINP